MTSNSRPDHPLINDQLDDGHATHMATNEVRPLVTIIFTLVLAVAGFGAAACGQQRWWGSNQWISKPFSEQFWVSASGPPMVGNITFRMFFS